jgi:hypothetical protein
MKRFVFFLAFALLLTTSASANLFEGTPSPNLNPVFGTLVNFDDGTTFDPVDPTHYLGVGVASIMDANNQLFYFPSTQSQPNYVGTGPDAGWAMDTTITLVNPTDQIGIGTAGPGEVTLTALDVNGNVLETYTFAFASNDYWYISRANSDIMSLEIVSSFIAIDDLQFNGGVSTPEPGSMFLLVSGLMSLALVRYRR